MPPESDPYQGKEIVHGWAIPTEEALSIKPNEFRLAPSLRLGIPPPFDDWNINNSNEL